MKNLTPSKNLFVKSLKKNMKDCQIIIDTHKNIPGTERCIELCQLCIGACSDCLIACESISEGIGIMLQNFVDTCNACAKKCKNMALNSFEDSIVPSDENMKLVR